MLRIISITMYGLLSFVCIFAWLVLLGEVSSSSYSFIDFVLTNYFFWLALVSIQSANQDFHDRRFDLM